MNSISDKECTTLGIAFVPARLRQKKQVKYTDEAMESSSTRGSNQKQDSGIWAPADSDEEDSDSGDSMSDLYPCKQNLKIVECF